MTTAKINKAIKRFNLEIIHQRGSGYSYFLDLTTGYQIGESIPMCHLNQQSLEGWVQDAAWARQQHDQSFYKNLYKDLPPVC